MLPWAHYFNQAVDLLVCGELSTCHLPTIPFFSHCKLYTGNFTFSVHELVPNIGHGLCMEIESIPFLYPTYHYVFMCVHILYRLNLFFFFNQPGYGGDIILSQSVENFQRVLQKISWQPSMSRSLGAHRVIIKIKKWLSKVSAIYLDLFWTAEPLAARLSLMVHPSEPK